MSDYVSIVGSYCWKTPFSGSQDHMIRLFLRVMTSTQVLFYWFGWFWLRVCGHDNSL